MLVIISSLGLYYNFSNLHSYSFHGDRDNLVSALQHARSQAVSNICYGACTDGKSHGVYIEEDQYIIFQGVDYASRDEDYDAFIEANPNIEHSGLDEVVFDQLTGDANAGDIIITDPTTSRTSTISINSEGQIIWTN